MKAPALRTQVLMVMGLILLYALGVGISFWLQARSHAGLDESFSRELGALADIPRLRDELRQLDQVTHNYLLTGDAQWLDRHRQALDKVRRISGGIAKRLEARDPAIPKELDARLTSYLSQQGQWVSRKEAGQLSTAEAVALVRKPRTFDDLTELVGRMTAASVAAMEGRGRAVRRVTAWTMAVILLAGLAAAAFVASFMSRYMVGPIAELRRYARGWVLGDKWDPEVPHAGPEVADLLDCLKDMTARLNAQYEAEQELGHLKGRLVSMASHEFGNALNIIGGLAALLKQGEGRQLNGERAKYYVMLNGNIRSLSVSALNLLEMGRLETGRFQVRPREMDVRPLLEETIKRLAPLIERKAHLISLDLPDGPLPVKGDPEALALVSTNLLANAIKYTPEGGSIALGLSGESDACAVVFVQDSGVGLSAQQKEAILTGRLHSEAGQRTGKGFGVGLDIAWHVLEAHGTALAVDSEPGKGSRFSFNLPWSRGAPRLL